MKGLAPQASKIFDAITRLECIKPFVLVGGTALSLQIGTRESEDLDFMRWKQGPNDSLEVGWPAIKQELETIGHIESINLLGLDMVEFVVDGVKISFYAAPRKQLPTLQIVNYRNNLRLADPKSIAAMKMETMLRRSKFRDYYDIYCVLRNGADIQELIPIALEHAGHNLKRRSLLSMLTNSERFRKEPSFLQLNPVYDVSPADIEEYIKQKLLEK